MANTIALQNVAHSLVRRVNSIVTQVAGLPDAADQATVDTITAELSQALILLDDDSDQLTAIS